MFISRRKFPLDKCIWPCFSSTEIVGNSTSRFWLCFQFRLISDPIQLNLEHRSQESSIDDFIIIFISPSGFCSGKSQWYILSPMLNNWIFLRLPIPDVNQETDMTSMEPYVCILMYFHLVFWMKDSALYTHSGEVEEQFMLHLPSSLTGKFLAIKRSLSIEELNKLSNLSLSASAEAAKQSMLFGSDFSILAGKGENIFFDLTLNSRIKI